MITFILQLIGGIGPILKGVRDAKGEERFPVYLFINRFCGRKDTSTFGKNTFSTLISEKSEFHTELTELTKSVLFGGSRKTPSLTVNGLHRLTEILGSNISQELRVPLCNTLEQVISGNRTLITEINQEKRNHNGNNKKHASETVSDDTNVPLEQPFKHFKTTDDFNVKITTSNQLIREHVPLREKMLELTTKEMELTTKQMELTTKQMDLEDTKRAKELAFIKAKAVAEAEAIRILESARANPRNEPERPAVLQFLPVDHTTIKKTYEETYPKFKTPLKKDEENFLNDARTRANRAFKADHGGLPPQQVREDIRLVDAFPKSWEGVLNTLAGIHRERYGHTQRSIHSFIHIQSQPVD